MTAVRARKIVSFACFLAAALAVTPRSASAQAALDDETIPEVEPTPTVPEDEVVHHGIAIRTRLMIVPQGELELFVEEAPSGMLEPGFSIDYVRRKGNFELVAGLGYDRIRTDEGLWLEKGDQPPADSPDLVTYDGLGWITAEVLFMWHKQLHEMFALRYGAGFGLGFIVGDALQTDTICTGSSTSSCAPAPGGQVDDPADIFPVFPVVNLRLGGQFKPTEQVAINVDFGLRTAFFASLGVTYFFN